MAENERFLLRVHYRKAGRLQFLGHLDVMRALERSVRRARLPFCVTQGFSPRMKCAFSAALPLGAASESEYFDLTLGSYVPAEEALAHLARALPDDLAPLEAAYVSPHSPALGAWLDRARWRLRLSTDASPDQVAAAVDALAAAGELSYMRGKKQKRVDLGRTLVGYEAGACDGGVELVVDTRSSNEGALRPEVLVRAAFCLPALAERSLGDVSVFREGQWHEEEDGSLVEAL
ncbi:TIGR03936 family radical SAM-associated protein [Atopobiaceae bacterium 24-176]